MPDSSGMGDLRSHDSARPTSPTGTGAIAPEHVALAHCPECGWWEGDRNLDTSDAPCNGVIDEGDTGHGCARMTPVAYVRGDVHDRALNMLAADARRTSSAAISRRAGTSTLVAALARTVKSHRPNGRRSWCAA